MKILAASCALAVCGPPGALRAAAHGSVTVEPAPALAPERALGRSAARRAPGSARRSLADRLRDVEPDEVQQRKRSHRVAGAEPHARVDVAASMPVSSSRRTALKRYGNSSRLTTNPGTSGTTTGVFSSVSQSACARARVSARRLAREDQLHELHPRDRVEDVQAHEALGTPLAPARAARPRARRSCSRARARRRACARAPSAPAALTSWSSMTASTTNVAAASASGRSRPARARGRPPPPAARVSSRRSRARARADSSSAPAAARARGGPRSPRARTRSRPSRRSPVLALARRSVLAGSPGVAPGLAAARRSSLACCSTWLLLRRGWWGARVRRHWLTDQSI